MLMMKYRVEQKYQQIFSSVRVKRRITGSWIKSAYQEVAWWKVVPDQTLHLTAKPPGPVTGVWTAAVIQDSCPEKKKC